MNDIKNRNLLDFLKGVKKDNRLQVDVGASILPTGAATSANQTTEITALQAIQATLQLQPSQFRSLTVDSTAQAVKASAGNLYGWNIINLHSATIFVKIYNIAAASVNPASSVPVRTLMISANGSIFQEPVCIVNANSTAISVRVVTDSSDTGTTAPSTLPIIELMYT